jgi:hypothetical protein
VIYLAAAQLVELTHLCGKASLFHSAILANSAAARSHKFCWNKTAARALQATEQIQNQHDYENGSDYSVRPVAVPITACRESSDQQQNHHDEND